MSNMLIHTIAAVLLEISYLGVGLLLCFMGQRLLERGVESRTKVEAEIVGNKWMLLTSSPGIIFCVCGLGIIIYAIITQSVYEERMISPALTHESDNTQISSEISQKATSTTSSKSSRLFDQQTEITPLRSMVAIYAIQHRQNDIADQDVTTDINQMPTEADVEPWSQTYQRFGNILRKNPTALSNMLNQTKFKWLTMKDQKDRSLCRLIETDLQRLPSNMEAKENK